MIAGLQAAQVSAGATVITTAVAIAALVFAWKQVTESKALREQQSRPFVVMDFRFRNVLALLSIENIGSTVARDIAISVDIPFRSTLPDIDPMDAYVIREGIRMLAPGRRLEILFDSVSERFKSDLPMTYEVSVSYVSYTGKKYCDRYVLDLQHLREILVPLENPTAEVLKDILAAVERSAGTIRGGVEAIARSLPSRQEEGSS